MSKHKEGGAGIHFCAVRGCGRELECFHKFFFLVRDVRTMFIKTTVRVDHTSSKFRLICFIVNDISNSLAGIIFFMFCMLWTIFSLFRVNSLISNRSLQLRVNLNRHLIFLSQVMYFIWTSMILVLWHKGKLPFHLNSGF